MPLGSPWLWATMEAWDAEWFSFLIGPLGGSSGSVMPPEVCIDIRGLWCHNRPWGFLWSMLQRECMLVSVGCADPWGHDDICDQVTSKDLVWVPGPTVARDCVYGLCCCQKPHRGPWSMLQLTLKSVEPTFVVISMAADAQLRGRDTEGFCDSPYLPQPASPTKRGQSRQNAIRELL